MIRFVLEHFINKSEIRKTDTEFYPDPVSSRGKDDFSPRARGLIFNEIEKCTGCGDCTKVCPVKCIEVQSTLNIKNNRPWVSKFEIDFSQCIFCGMCVDICEPNSLIQTKEIQAAVFKPEDLVASFGRGPV